MAHPRNLTKLLGRAPGKDVHWTGVHANRNDCPTFGDGFAANGWVEGCLERLRHLLQKGRSDGAHARLGALPCLLLAARTAGTTRFVDFGGGAAYLLPILRTAVPNVRLEYHLVEHAAIIEALQQFDDSLEGAQYHTSINDVPGPVDIIYARTAIQYHDDPYALLEKFAELEPDSILLEACSTGDVPDFFAAQRTLRNSSIPYAFLNRDHVVRHLENLGYQLAMELIDDQELDMRNLPSTHRIGRSRTLLFNSKSGASPA